MWITRIKYLLSIAGQPPLKTIRKTRRCFQPSIFFLRRSSKRKLVPRQSWKKIQGFWRFEFCESSGGQFWKSGFLNIFSRESSIFFLRPKSLFDLNSVRNESIKNVIVSKITSSIDVDNFSTSQFEENSDSKITLSRFYNENDKTLFENTS